MNDSVIFPAAIAPILLGLEGYVVWYEPGTSAVSIKSEFEWIGDTGFYEVGHRKLLLDSPYVIIPEALYSPGHDPLILQDRYPYLSVSQSRYAVDTWIGNYAKCIYYVPDKYYRKGYQYMHWLTCLSAYNQKFFDQHDNGIWSLRMKEKLYTFIKINRVLKGIKIIHAPSPDDSTYHLLKIAETMQAYQSSLSLWTNENNQQHLNILCQYIPSVITTDQELTVLLHDIISYTCAS